MLRFLCVSFSDQVSSKRFDARQVSMSTYFNGREIFLIDWLPENTSRDSVETMGSGTGKWQARYPRHRKCAVVLDQRQGQAWRWPQKRPALTRSALDGVCIPRSGRGKACGAVEQEKWT